MYHPVRYEAQSTVSLSAPLSLSLSRSGIDFDCAVSITHRPPFGVPLAPPLGVTQRADWWSGCQSRVADTRCQGLAGRVTSVASQSAQRSELSVGFHTNIARSVQSAYLPCASFVVTEL